MKKLLLHIARVITVIAIVISTTGFNVYIHHCNTSGETYSSVFISDGESDMCEHEIKVTNSCCSTNSSCEIKNNECCSDFKKYLKADIDITIQYNDIKVSQSVITVLDYLIMGNELNKNTFEEKFTSLVDIPPPSGIKEDIIAFLNNRKVAPALFS